MIFLAISILIGCTVLGNSIERGLERIGSNIRYIGTGTFEVLREKTK